MRGFIVLCLTAVAFAAPQGYNYNPTGAVQQTTGFGGNYVAPSSSGSAGFFQGATGGQQAFFSQGSSNVGVSHHQQQHHQQQQQQAVVSKRFYIHSAPEDGEDEYKEQHITVGVPKKNYNVVFIKAPQKAHKKTAIKISPAVNEEKTVIYVLNKKADSSDIQAEVIEHASPTSKPEVFFIKYKTAEEAAHAQQQIQAQYDALGGSSQVTDEGVAPVTSVIGSLGGDAGAAGAGVAGHGGVATGVVSSGSFGGAHGVATGSHSSNAYLPPNF
ncbi:uncharacterized protein LOC119676577 [Teleopsis dalmanni]|uniref:uncharacterized protein LOC119676574 n=1 Tax=Teleopsis dalmanni TaxID=139649 RepID=UPI0018CF0530|nr:uncharacterized protein LOC119676574 [Teleopsis dalmanni]XP_037943747.1 uncharacterized protein LOC119676577 [Teleopsis dalmanni]